MSKISTRYNSETYVAISTITAADGTRCVGYAECSPQDIDLVNEKTGCYIAERRAYIDYLKKVVKRDISAELKTLKKFYNVVNQSKYYNAEDYTNQMLIRHISRLENDLAAIKEEIEIEYDDLHDYIDSKEKFYQAIRKHRKAAEENN